MKTLLLLVLCGMAWGQQKPNCADGINYCNGRTMTLLAPMTIDPIEPPPSGHRQIEWLRVEPSIPSLQIVEGGALCAYSDGWGPCPEPMDVPAIQEDLWYEEGWRETDRCFVGGGTVLHTCKNSWTCSDPSRILLTAEDGTKHCIKF